MIRCAVSGLPVVAMPVLAHEGILTFGAVFATTDQNGRFQMVGLAPDSYYVVVINRINEIRGLQDMVQAVGRETVGRVEIKVSRDSNENIALSFRQ